MYHLALIVILCSLMNTHSLAAEELQGRDWGVTKKFRSQEARLELSGAVCPGSDDQKKWCLAVNDEKRWAQFFSIKEGTLKPRDSLLLLPKKQEGEKFKEIDAEAAAYDDGFVYVTGSHGLSRKKCKFRQSQFFVFRFPVDTVSGMPAFSISEDEVAAEIQRSANLGQIIKDAPHVGAFAEKCLDNDGVNIEGLTVIDGQMYFGFRGPSTEGHAFVLQVAADSVFGDAPSDTVVHKLNLGIRTGIRDLTRVDGGFLVLTGHVNQEDIAPEILFWEPGTGQLEALGKLPIIPEKKAETLLVLEEKFGVNKIEYRVLILYDGLQNGNPTEFELERKQ